MDRVKLTKEDLIEMEVIYKELIMTIKKHLPKKIFSSEKFGALVVQATMNLVCALSVISSLTKKEMMEALSSIWDERERLNAGPLN